MEDLKIPKAIEVEEAILGAIFVDEDALDNIITILKPEMFYKPIHQKIYAKMVELSMERTSIDVFTIADELKTDLETNGGTSMLLELTMKIASANKIVQHANIVREKYLLRNMAAKLPSIVSKILRGDEAQKVVAETLSYFEELQDLSAGSSAGMAHISEISERSLQEATKRQEQYIKGGSVAISTGLYDLNTKITGWRGGEMVILGARPGQGKTQLMLHFAKTAAMQGKKVCIYSLEMSDVSLVNRLLLAESGVDRDAFKRGSLSEEDWSKLNDAQDRLRKLDIYIDSRPSVNINYIAAHSRLMRKKSLCDIIFLDYLQLTDTISIRKSGTREEEISELGRRIKNLARELDVPIITLSQLSRAVEQRADKMPILSDLRESGQLEAHSDIVMFVMRPEYYGIEEIENKALSSISTKGLGILSVAKQRDGAVGNCFFAYNDNFTQIYDYGHTPDFIEAKPANSDIVRFLPDFDG